MSSKEVEALQSSVSGFVRAFGLLDRERTPCGLDLHVSEAHLLGDLASEGPLGQRQLAERLHLAKSTVSRLVSVLAGRGWLVRAADVSDGRAVLVALTDAGRDVADRLGRARARRFEHLLAAVPEGSRSAVVDGIGLLAAAAACSRNGVPA